MGCRCCRSCSTTQLGCRGTRPPGASSPTGRPPPLARLRTAPRAAAAAGQAAPPLRYSRQFTVPGTVHGNKLFTRDPRLFSFRSCAEGSRQKLIMRIRSVVSVCFLGILDPDPDPFVRDPDPSITNQKYVVRKALIPTVLWHLCDVLSLKNEVNAASKSNKQKNLIFLAAILKVTDESEIHYSEVWICGSGFVPKCHGSVRNNVKNNQRYKKCWI
jgi:hypothetical protein